jgi:hypothetical protein
MLVCGGFTGEGESSEKLHCPRGRIRDRSQYCQRSSVPKEAQTSDKKEVNQGDSH